ncbi:MAG TPA: hypothetical protein VFS21_39980 [Roseiflexaceae bacterium]|nr:hypothetical protein [Roseiflexaceae bacterium]
MNNTPDPRALAEAVRAACLRAAAEGYERAAVDGLCAEGAWEAALEAVRAIDLGRLLADVAAGRAAERA